MNSVTCPWCKQKIFVAQPELEPPAPEVIAVRPHLLTDALLSVHRALERIECRECHRPISLIWYGDVRW